jgi:hypothetical protein
MTNTVVHVRDATVAPGERPVQGGCRRIVGPEVVTLLGPTRGPSAAHSI